MTRALNLGQMMMLAEYASTEEVREKAGTEAITLAVAHGLYPYLIDIASDERFSDAIRNKAAQSIDVEVATKLIKRYDDCNRYANGDSYLLTDFVSNERLSDEVRRIFEQAIRTNCTTLERRL